MEGGHGYFSLRVETQGKIERLTLKKTSYHIRPWVCFRIGSPHILVRQIGGDSSGDEPKEPAWKKRPHRSLHN
jgi:hypothetical protein